VIKAVSHLVVATDDVTRITRFFVGVFGITPHFENDMFAEFVLPSQFRIAFFKPVGASAKTFKAKGERATCSFGITVENVDECYAAVEKKAASLGGKTGGPPKAHPWGEKSFLLIDCDDNRWEVCQSPSPSGMLINRES
jgi:predicted enzyme related to lactoylglutathione lyase